MRKYVLYHAHCPDGFGAAYAAWKVYGKDAIYLPVNHHQAMPELRQNSEVFLLDFCYPQADLKKLAQTMQSVVILDHHQSAEKDLSTLDLSQYPNLSVTFDMQKSGAVLAWEYFHPNQEVPELLYYIQDKDLWRFVLPQSKEVSAALRSYEMDFNLWDKFELERLKTEGKALLRYQNQMVERLCQNARFINLGGYEVPAVNSSVLQSEIGNQLCKLYPEAKFAVAYFDTSENRHFSLRSIGEFNVAEVAKKFGGGGHPNAAGFAQKQVPFVAP